ncbi:c-type cytochrome [uncultured Hymenobacter sp.]|uniref:c-type cytochrome n=1 Tax=uncultured Hymenobacter sp. TaxID=170016 RepID=UPI0035CC7393
MGNTTNNTCSRFIRRAILPLFVAATVGLSAQAQETPKEEDFFKIMRVTAPEGIILEVGGLAMLPNGDLGVSTRRGDVFVVQNPTSRRPYFRKFASGLHEILGLAYKDGALYCAQRGELTKLVDTNNDGKADVYETVYAWPLSGHYHEYSFGPKIAPDGSFFVSGNVAFGNEQWWRGESRVPWRGWTMNITPDGKMQPWATGMRSPAGLGMIDGELFYTDNQGEYVGSGGIWHVTKGAFTGHPAGLKWTGLPNSPLKVTTEQFNALVDPRDVKDSAGKAIKPENVVNEKFVTVADVKKAIPGFRSQAVTLPHTILGISNSEIIKIPDNTFGPFAGQLLVGDQGQSKIMRVVMEKVKGEYQGVAFDFRGDFQSGVLRIAFAPDGSLFVGETNRGWGSAGEANAGLQRLVWNKSMPFEMRTISARPDGFEIEFTKPVDRKSAEDLASYAVQSFTYKYHPVYGSPPVNTQEHQIKGVKVSEDGLKARIVVNNLRQNYIHNITLEGVREKENSYSLVHTTAFYTLNNIPDGEKLALNQVSTRNSGTAYGKIEIPTKLMADRFNFKLAAKAPESKPKGTTATSTQKTGAKAMVKVTPVVNKTPSLELVKPLLAKYTCLACHNADKRQVGPAYKEVAKRRYTPEQIVQLIHNPKPQNWPEYATEMPPMPQVKKEDALKIANWINSLASQSASSAKK